MDIGAAASSINLTPTCEIKFKHVIEPFSYVTLITGSDKEHFTKLSHHRWNFHLTPINNLVTRTDEPITVWLATK